ncbi:RNA-binding protein 33-like [Rana temporaria]|uniref:RNA-binding protein 33-like n=1 Tax=Rana temporaria TaxID=8407 RepID=UPI001AAC62A7|nr:RNA-binding protein 33-like [Rana temporaria]
MSFDLSQSIKEEEVESPAVEADLQEPENEEVYEEVEDMEAGAEDFVGSYEDNYEVPNEQIEYQDDETTDEVLDFEITEPLDEFQFPDEDEETRKYSLKIKEQKYLRGNFKAEGTASPTAAATG